MERLPETKSQRMVPFWLRLKSQRGRNHVAVAWISELKNTKADTGCAESCWRESHECPLLSEGNTRYPARSSGRGVCRLPAPAPQSGDREAQNQHRKEPSTKVTGLHIIRKDSVQGFLTLALPQADHILRQAASLL